MKKIDTGNKGEQIAQDFLKHLGYTIIETNWHCQYGEIDIIANQDKTLAFIEVRTRHATDTESALESITERKKQRFIKSIHSYLNHTNNETALWRADIIAIALQSNKTPIINHVEDALGW